jgi:hypothetical protein
MVETTTADTTRTLVTNIVVVLTIPRLAVSCPPEQLYQNSILMRASDELGHCQKCQKWNSTNMFSNEPQPTIATKFKRSLISNLGNTALTQMCLLMLCTLALVGASIAIAVP